MFTRVRTQIWGVFINTILVACGSSNETNPEDFPPTSPEVTASAETVGAEGDVDDIAVWVHPSEPAQSLIIGTEKSSDEHALYVYNLDGQLVQTLENGRINNVDLRYNFSLADTSVALVGGTNRTNDTLAFWAINETTGELTRVSGDGLPADMLVYGFCMYQSAGSGNTFAFVNAKSGEIHQYRLFDAGNQTVSGELVRTLDVPSQPEGCVADDKLGMLYVGEEDAAIWRFEAEPDASTQGVIIAETGTEALTADVEGLAIYHGSDDEDGYLLASSQGSNTYVAFARTGDNALVGTWRLVSGDGIDAASESDGIEVTSAALGPQFPQGLFIAHDTANEGFTGNFKLVRWDDIAAAVDGIEVMPGYDPRAQ